MKIVAMIPIKLNSERVPGKNLKKFYDGKVLMSFIQNACLKSKKIDEVYVYCSDESVKDYLLNGVKYLNRPVILDQNSANCNDIIRQFMKKVDADIYVVSHATSPFTKASSIDKCISAVQSGNYDSSFLAKKTQCFMWQNNKALNFDPQHFPRTQDLTPIFEESSGAFVFTKETFKNFDRRVGVNPFICEIDEIEAIDIDNPIDFDIANAIYKEVIGNEDPN